MDTQVFVSYASQDKSFVEQELVPVLHDLEVKPWYADREIIPARRWETEIRRNLNGCDWFLVVVSEASVQSDWVQTEVHWALELKPRRIIPILVDESDPGDCHMRLKLIQYVRWGEDAQLAHHRLVSALSTVNSEDNIANVATAERESVDLVQRLRALRAAPDTSEIPFVFGCLAHDEEGIRGRAMQVVQKIGWDQVAENIETVAKTGLQSSIEDILSGLAAIEATESTVATLAKLCEIFSGNLRDRVLTLTERKRLSLQLGDIAKLFRNYHQPYELVRVLGLGLFTASYLGKHIHSGNEVVIRVLRPELALQDDIRTLYLELINRSMTYIHQMLAHTSYVNQFAEDKVYFCIRDYIDGISLQKALDAGQNFQPHQVVEILKQITTAFTPIHDLAEFHGGVKPSNIFLIGKYKVLLGDTSLPVSLLPPTIERLAYDYRYAAPESFQIKQTLGPQADYYSLGCVAYELLCGEPPFTSNHPFHLANFHREKNIKAPSQVRETLNPKIDKLLLMLLYKNPSQRPSNVGEVLQILDELAECILSPKQKELRAIKILDKMRTIPPDSTQIVIPSPEELDVDHTYIKKAPTLAYLHESPAGTEERHTDEPLSFSQDLSESKTQYKTVPKRISEGPDKENALPEMYILEGRYTIEKVLGSGGFGITYLAKHRYLEDIWVAIKEYLPAGVAVRDSDSHVHVISEQHSKIYSWGLERFLDEARLLRQFQHPNIVSVSDYFEANNTAYLVMDYVKGHSIQSDLDAGIQFDENKIRRIVYPLITALQLIHREGLYHRDISPDNILLREEDDSPVLIDFGSARYEMRMHGADQSNSDQAHTPTSIFKQGYSPIEQYDGTPQGPYTDIYALGATLYRTAFGVRPTEAMTRSGEIRMTKTDPLIPSSEKGKGRYSDEFLRAIDAALQLDASDRPQTTNEWLDIFGPPEEPNQLKDYAASHPRLSGWRKAFAAGMLVVTVATAGYFGYQWYEEKKDIQILPSDIPGLISHATAKLIKAPFSEETQDEAKHIYLQILNQDNGNIRALAGYSAVHLLKQFNNSLKEEDRPKAVVLLNKAESELKLVGIDRKALEPGWQRIERLNHLVSLRAALYRAPLDPDNWPSVKVLIKNISLLPDGSELAKSGNQGLQALARVNNFISKNQFAKAREHLVIAEEHLSLLGLGNLDKAKSEIDKSEARFAAERLEKITALLQTAEERLQTTPLTTKVLNGALTTYDEILKLDGRQSKALAGRVLIEKLVTAFTAMDQNDFETSRYALDSAQRIAASAGIAPDAVNQATTQLTKRLQSVHLSKPVRP